jgi:uncharacterized surface protein with fasciclin (FAS1) repeats
MSNITQIFNDDKRMTTLKKGAIALGLDKKLSETGPFTVFAPSDSAYEQLGKAMLDHLLQQENKAGLAEVLNFHIVSGKILVKDLKDGEILKTINGKELEVHVKDGAVRIDGAKIHGRDVQASNGVIYSLDTVMMKN